MTETGPSGIALHERSDIAFENRPVVRESNCERVETPATDRFEFRSPLRGNTDRRRYAPTRVSSDEETAR